MCNEKLEFRKCQRCKENAYPFTYCDHHREVRKKWSKTYRTKKYKENKEKGLCRSIGCNTPVTIHLRCEKHLKQQREYRKRVYPERIRKCKQQNLCTSCLKPLDEFDENKTTCMVCRDYRVMRSYCEDIERRNS